MKLPIYLDNNATTPIDPEVIEAMLPVLKTHFGNPASQTHSFGWYAAELVKIAREEVGALIDAKIDEIVFTSCATESNNAAIKGVFFDCLSKNPTKQPHIISVVTEHPSILDSLSAVAKMGAEVELLQVNSRGVLSPEVFAKALKPQTVLASVMLANNEIGVVQDIQALSKLANDNGTLFHSDATQAAGKLDISASKLGVDLLSISGHKLYGPKGIGVLYIKRCKPKLSIEPLIHGSSHEHGRRGGTLNVPGIVGLGKACYLANKKLKENKKHVEKLTSSLLATLSDRIPELSLNGPSQNRLPGNLNISFKNIEGSLLLPQISSKLAISMSSACTSESAKPSHVLQALGLDEKTIRSSIRIGIGRFNTEEEIRFAADVLVDTINELRQ